MRRPVYLGALLLISVVGTVFQHQWHGWPMSFLLGFGCVGAGVGMSRLIGRLGR